MFIQILMSVLLMLVTVTLMLPVPTLLVASPAPVTRDTLEMGSHVWVSVTIKIASIQILMSVHVEDWGEGAMAYPIFESIPAWHRGLSEAATAVHSVRFMDCFSIQGKTMHKLPA
jgi:hypothetical protein